MSTTSDKVTTVNESDKDVVTINLLGFFNSLKSRWHWFIFSILFFSLAGYFYNLYTPPIFEITSRLLVKDDKGGGGNVPSTALMNLGGLLQGRSSVDNESEVLKTRFLMEQVVRQMQLNIIYAYKPNFAAREIYNPPFNLQIVKGVDTIAPTNIEITNIPPNKIQVKTRNFTKVVDWNQQFNLPGVGDLLLTRTGVLSNAKYIVTVTSLDQRVSELMKQLTVGLTNKQVTIIDLKLAYPLQKKGEDILNTLISKYTQAGLGDKNSIADSTYKFIQERLSIISTELGDVENSVEEFKQRNKLSDMSEQGKLLVKNSGEYASELAKSETQVSILNDMENYLRDASKDKRVLPSALLPQDMVFSNLMNEYNALLVERDKLMLSVTEGSPFVQNLDNQIAGLKRSILSNIQSTKNAFVSSRDKARKQLQQAEGLIGGVPLIEKNYLKLARNQQIKQELYIFLMQKAEETAISKTSNIAAAKVIDPPKAEVLPLSPKKGFVYLTSLVLGFIFPLFSILILSWFRTSISSKEDITNRTNVNVIGEISHNNSNDNLIVANQGRSAISEQFRALRTNLAFYLRNKFENVILLTSSMSGEGKSFTAINLANILALSGKKVLLMELDLRKPGLSAKLDIDNSVGFSNYTIDSNLQVNDIIKPLIINPNMFIISSGPLPPNPAETLMFSGMNELMENLKEKFDYIIMDAPPIGVIADAQLLAPYADVTLYLIRHKVTQKRQISILEDLYKTGKMKNLGVVINDIKDKEYGYGYGYGNYGQEFDESFLSKLKNKFKRG